MRSRYGPLGGRRKLAIVAVASATAIVLTACGGGSGKDKAAKAAPSSPSQSEQAAAPAGPAAESAPAGTAAAPTAEWPAHNLSSWHTDL